MEKTSDDVLTEMEKYNHSDSYLRWYLSITMTIFNFFPEIMRPMYYDLIFLKSFIDGKISKIVPVKKFYSLVWDFL